MQNLFCNHRSFQNQRLWNLWRILATPWLCFTGLSMWTILFCNICWLAYYLSASRSCPNAQAWKLIHLQTPQEGDWPRERQASRPPMLSCRCSQVEPSSLLGSRVLRRPLLLHSRAPSVRSQVPASAASSEPPGARTGPRRMNAGRAWSAAPGREGLAPPVRTLRSVPRLCLCACSSVPSDFACKTRVQTQWTLRWCQQSVNQTQGPFWEQGLVGLPRLPTYEATLLVRCALYQRPWVSVHQQFPNHVLQKRGSVKRWQWEMLLGSPPWDSECTLVNYRLWKSWIKGTISFNPSFLKPVWHQNPIYIKYLCICWEMSVAHRIKIFKCCARL